MNKNVMLMSLLMAVVAVGFMYSYVQGIEENAKKRYGTDMSVVVASRDIAEMENLTDSMVETRVIPSKFREPTVVMVSERDPRNKEVTVGVISDLKELSGMVAIVPIKKGEQVTFNKIAEPGFRTGLAPQIAPGKRAVAVPVTEVTSAGKLIKPGDRVDVLVTLNPGQDRRAVFTNTLFQDVVVLAVGRSVTNNMPRVVEQESGSRRLRTRSLIDYDGFATLTLEVDPRQAQAISLLIASPTASFNFALRNNDDTERMSLTPLSYGELVGGDPGVTSRLPAQAPGRR